MSWAAGTQCVAKCRHKKPKPGELAFQKGDILTIVESSSVRSRACGESWCCSLPKLIYLVPPPPPPPQKKGHYLARHNETEEEGLVSGADVRERQALCGDPSLSLMPYVFTLHTHHSSPFHTAGRNNNA